MFCLVRRWQSGLLRRPEEPVSSTEARVRTVLYTGYLLSVAPFAGAGGESVYDRVEVIHHTTHSMRVGGLLGYEIIHPG